MAESSDVLHTIKTLPPTLIILSGIDLTPASACPTSAYEETSPKFGEKIFEFPELLTKRSFFTVFTFFSVAFPYLLLMLLAKKHRCGRLVKLIFVNLPTTERKMVWLSAPNSVPAPGLLEDRRSGTSKLRK